MRKTELPSNIMFITNNVIQKSKNKKLKKEWSKLDFTEKLGLCIVLYALRNSDKAKLKLKEAKGE